MRRNISAIVCTIGAVTALGISTGVPAWASWATTSNDAAVTATAAQTPKMKPPTAEMSKATPKITWSTIPTSLVDHYVVRDDGRSQVVVCTVAAPASSCTDGGANPGRTLWYLVRATMGTGWVGPDSDPSETLSVPESTVPASAGNAVASSTEPAAPSTGPPPHASRMPDDAAQSPADSNPPPAVPETSDAEAAPPPSTPDVTDTTEPHLPAETATSTTTN
jgi:hypothetical protein